MTCAGSAGRTGLVGKGRPTSTSGWVEGGREGKGENIYDGRAYYGVLWIL